MDQYFDFGLRIDNQSQPLGRILLDAGLIDEPQLREILEIQHQNRSKGHDRIEIGEIIANRYGIPRMVIEGYFIREQLVHTIKDLFYGTLCQDSRLDADQIIAKTDIRVRNWEAEMTETTHFKEEAARGARIDRQNRLNWVKGEVCFEIKEAAAEAVLAYADFFYQAGSRPDIDLFAVLANLKPHLLKNRHATGDYDYDTLGMATED